MDNYVRTLIDIKPNQSIAVAMKAGRLENGFSATLDIVTADSTEEPVAAAAPVTEAAPAPVSTPVAKATPFPNRRVAAPAAVVAEPEPVIEPIYEDGPEDAGPIEVTDLEDEPGSEEPEPVAEAAPMKRSIFSKAS